MFAIENDVTSSEVQEARQQLVAKLSSAVTQLNVHTFSIGRVATIIELAEQIAELTPGGIEDLDAILAGREALADAEASVPIFIVFGGQNG